MSDFKAKMLQIRFWPGLAKTPLGELNFGALKLPKGRGGERRSYPQSSLPQFENPEGTTAVSRHE